jgi:hypothetical protein
VKKLQETTPLSTDCFLSSLNRSVLSPSCNHSSCPSRFLCLALSLHARLTRPPEKWVQPPGGVGMMPPGLPQGSGPAGQAPEMQWAGGVPGAAMSAPTSWAAMGQQPLGGGSAMAGARPDDGFGSFSAAPPSNGAHGGFAAGTAQPLAGDDGFGNFAAASSGELQAGPGNSDFGDFTATAAHTSEGNTQFSDFSATNASPGAPASLGGVAPPSSSNGGDR